MRLGSPRVLIGARRRVGGSLSSRALVGSSPLWLWLPTSYAGRRLSATLFSTAILIEFHEAGVARAGRVRRRKSRGSFDVVQHAGHLQSEPRQRAKRIRTRDESAQPAERRRRLETLHRSENVPLHARGLC